MYLGFKSQIMKKKIGFWVESHRIKRHSSFHFIREEYTYAYHSLLDVEIFLKNHIRFNFLKQVNLQRKGCAELMKLQFKFEFRCPESMLGTDLPLSFLGPDASFFAANLSK